jgi:hypothetical protein
MRSKPKHWRWLALGVGLAVLVAFAAYFTGDQDKKVAWSSSFTVDTSDLLSVTQPFTIPASELSGLFTIDTRDGDSVSRPLTLRTSSQSNFFTIDTREPDSAIFALSIAASETSPAFTIDTRSSGTTYTTFGFFTIDTREPDSVAFAFSSLMAEQSAGFTIDTRQPPPEDSDNDKIHDLWERLYFGSVFAYGPNDDPDGDGISNFLEFATGTDPTKINVFQGIEFWPEYAQSGNKMYLRYNRHILAARMVKYEIVMSEELRSWIDQTQKWNQIAEVVAGNGYVERLTLEYSVVGTMPTKAFVSLKITPFIQ